MGAKRSSAYIPICLTASVLSWLPLSVVAQEKTNRQGLFLAGIAGGYGVMHMQTGSSPTRSEGTFALGFRGGYAIYPGVVTGVELNGWTLEAYDFNDPSKGESISNMCIFANYFPLNNSPVYLTAGVGQMSYTNNTLSLTGREDGRSWFVGSGYEYPLTEKISLAPQIRFSHGNSAAGNFKTYEITVGVNWYSGD